MLKRILVMLMSITYIATVFTGLNVKKTFTDINKLDNKLDFFEVGIIEQQLAEIITDEMRNTLIDNSAYILKVRSVGNLELDFLCATEPVEVVDVYKGDNISKGEKISVFRSSSRLFYQLNGFNSINMDFVNAMKTGDEYLIFLEKKIDDISVYRTVTGIIAPIFSIKDRKNIISKSLHTDGCMSVPYDDVKDNEFFVADEGALNALISFKKIMISEFCC